MAATSPSRLLTAVLLALHAGQSFGTPTHPVLVATPPQLSDGGGEEAVISWDLASFTPLPGDRVLVSCGPRATFDDCLEKGGELPVNTSSPRVAGSVRSASLINMRCNYTFVYVRAPPSQPAADGAVLAELAVPLAPGLATSPTQGHIAFADRVDEMWVLWTSASTGTPTVRYSTEPFQATPVPTPTPAGRASALHKAAGTAVRTATGSSGTYRATDMCSAPANQTGQQLFIDPGLMHRVLLTGASLQCQQLTVAVSAADRCSVSS